VLAVKVDSVSSIGGFRSVYFLYWEEVDLAVRLRAAGFDIENVPTAVAWQEPNGTPPYLLARNRLLLWRQQRDWWRVVATIFTIVRLMARQIAWPRPTRLWRLGAYACGLRDGFTGNLDRSLALRRLSSF
jgi:GT2 family glycosyltransferase